MASFRLVSKMSEFSLYRLCLWKTAMLLKEGFWKETHEENEESNPFSCLPSSVIEELISCILQLTASGSLRVTDLYHLLTSGRVKHFKLEDVLLCTEQLVSILMSLSVACQNLVSIILRNVYCSDHFVTLHNSKTFLKSAALECVLSISPHLETIESCIEFDLKAIRNCERLKVLRLNFVPTTPIFNFLEESGGQFWPNESLMVLDVFEDARNPVSYLEVATVLKYCRALTEIHNDVSKSLEYLHSHEIYNGTLTAEYKLQKCFLGSAYLVPPFATASIVSVHIATLTCPNMKELDILVNDNNVIYALSDFQLLDSLLIQWESTIGGDFQLGVHLLLDKIGPNLKTLNVLNFFNVDFAALGSKCPNLEALKVEYQTEFYGYNSPASCFQNLKCLYIENIGGESSCRENTLVLLLSSCTDLITVNIQCAECLNDRVLRQILEKNTLSKVKEATILDCALSADGVRNFITHLKALEYFHFKSTAIIFEEAASIVHEINPHVIMRSDQLIRDN